MERQAGLGRSLQHVLDSLTPVESDRSAPGRVLFEPDDLEQQLDQLTGDVAALRERVQLLVGPVPEDATDQHDERKVKTKSKNKTKTKNKKKKKKKKSGAKGKRTAG
jgi:regulator of replication initiation timing